MGEVKLFPRELRNADARAWRGNVPVRHSYTLGVAGERFFRHLRDKGELIASVHEGSDLPHLPPRIYSPDSFAPVEEWVKVGPVGTVDTFTIVSRGRDGTPLEAPRALAFIRIHGADGGLLHWVGGCDAGEVTIGMRVKAVFRPRAKRRGSLHDIRHFAPTG